MAKVNRKHSRNKVWCAAYRSRQQADRNKALKLARHIRRCPWDDCAREALEKLPQAFQKGLALPAKCHSPAAERKARGLTLSGMERARRAA